MFVSGPQVPLEALIVILEFVRRQTFEMAAKVLAILEDMEEPVVFGCGPITTPEFHAGLNVQPHVLLGVGKIVRGDGLEIVEGMHNMLTSIYEWANFFDTWNTVNTSKKSEITG